MNWDTNNRRRWRPATCQLLDLVDQGMVDNNKLIRDLLAYMSEDEVADFARCNEYLTENEDNQS